MVRSIAATCSAMVYSASRGAGDPPNPSRSIAMQRWLPSMSGNTFWNVTEDDATPWISTTRGPSPRSRAM